MNSFAIINGHTYDGKDTSFRWQDTNSDGRLGAGDSLYMRVDPAGRHSRLIGAIVGGVSAMGSVSSALEGNPFGIYLLEEGIRQGARDGRNNEIMGSAVDTPTEVGVRIGSDERILARILYDPTPGTAPDAAGSVVATRDSFGRPTSYANSVSGETFAYGYDGNSAIPASIRNPSTGFAVAEASQAQFEGAADLPIAVKTEVAGNIRNGR